MALNIGDQAASSGMTKAIYDQLQAVLESDLEGLGEEEKAPIRQNWKKMAFAVATGVINHILSNMEIVGIKTRGNVSTTISGATAPAPPAAHVHNVNLTGKQEGFDATQSNDGTGHVQ
jgi:hypothetical protein